jgi:hypothetical protein
VRHVSRRRLCFLAAYDARVDGTVAVHEDLNGAPVHERIGPPTRDPCAAAGQPLFALAGDGTCAMSVRLACSLYA